MRTLFLLLLSCLTGFSQFGVEQPMFQLASVPSFVIPYSTNLFLDLDDSDLATGQITGWTSRVNGVYFTHATKGPYKESSGLTFYGTNILQRGAGSPTISSNCYFVVFQHNNGTFDTLFGSGGSEGLIMIGTTKRWHTYGNAQAIGDVYHSLGLVNNQLYDICFAGGTTHVSYTNGVSSTTDGLDNSVHWDWTYFGGNQAGGTSDPFTGKIRKVLWWTNMPAGLSASDVTYLHNWATNNYGYGP